jgi:hypothetical protein
MRTAALCAMTVIWLAGPAAGQTRAVAGQFGVLGEWDLTASVTKQAAGHWSGPARMRHVGYCTVEGPEEKIGELQLKLVEDRSRVNGTLLIDGVACAFSARLKDGYDGTLRCPDRRDVPMTLSVD